jgi:hypothetical protein
MHILRHHLGFSLCIPTTTLLSLSLACFSPSAPTGSGSSEHGSSSDTQVGGVGSSQGPSTSTLTPTDSSTTQSDTQAGTSTGEPSTSNGASGTRDDTGRPGTSSTGEPEDVCTKPNGDGPEFDCSTYAQDCAQGERCSLFSTIGEVADSTVCLPIPRAALQDGQACQNLQDGTDLCDVGSTCFRGICVPFASCGPDEAPSCPKSYPIPLERGFEGSPGTMHVCTPSCDPTNGASACPFQSNGCYFDDAQFVCAPDASGEDSGSYGSTCDFTNACDPGLSCAPATAVPACAGSGCCSPFCDLSQPLASQTCPGFPEGQQCIPYFTPGMEPDGYSHVGFCSL